jgi:hypothetical protein
MPMPLEARGGLVMPRRPQTCAQGHLTAQAGENDTGMPRLMKTAKTCENKTGRPSRMKTCAQGHQTADMDDKGTGRAGTTENVRPCYRMARAWQGDQKCAL